MPRVDFAWPVDGDHDLVTSPFKEGGPIGFLQHADLKLNGPEVVDGPAIAS
jgi:hypothetical protein